VNSSNTKEKLFFLETVAFALIPALITVMLYFFDKAPIALAFNNMIYVSSILVGVGANPLVSANLDSVNKRAVPFLAIFVCIFIAIGFLFSLSPDKNLSVICIIALYVMREIVRFRRHSLGVFFVSTLIWMPVFTLLWISLGEEIASLLLYGYTVFVFFITTVKILDRKTDYIAFFKSYRLLSSAVVDQSFSSGINLVYINATDTIFGPLFIRLISVVDVAWNVIGSHILSRAGENSGASVAKFLTMTSKKIRFILIAPVVIISCLSVYFAEPKLAAVCLLKTVKYFAGWTYKVLLLMGRQSIFFYVHLVFAIILSGSLMVFQSADIFYSLVVLGALYHGVGYYFASIEALNLFKKNRSNI